MNSIGFIGLGKLGLDCAEVFAEQYTVYGYDIYPRHSNAVKICESVKDVVDQSDWIFIAVPTPHEQGYDGSLPSSHKEPKDFDYSAVIDVLKKINKSASDSKNIVLISTVLPGTTRKHFAKLLNKKHQFFYNPYLIAMGSVKWDMVNPEMIMIGTEDGDEYNAQDLVDIYRPLMQNDPRYVIGTWDECEAIKIFYNTFISTKIGLVNMIQDCAMRVGNINVDIVTDALANSTMRIMGSKYMTAGMGDSGACHPRDNIALRWLAAEYDFGYDIFDTVMRAREQQAKNLASFLVEQSISNDNLPIVIHGKAYKPGVSYCIGSYSTLVGHYIKELGHSVSYVDPLADDPEDVVDTVNTPAIVLLAHNSNVTYGYTGEVEEEDKMFFEVYSGSVIVDPWRTTKEKFNIKVIHYGNTRKV